MRAIRADGTPFPRRRAVKWEFVRSVLRYRQNKRDLLKRGFHPIDPTAGQGFHLFDAIGQSGRRITEVEINVDGTMLYVKLDGGDSDRSPKG